MPLDFRAAIQGPETGLEPGTAAEHGFLAADHLALGHLTRIGEQRSEIAGTDVFRQGCCDVVLYFYRQLIRYFHDLGAPFFVGQF